MSALSRRSFLQGKQAVAPVGVRPPWSLAEDAFLAACDQCGACQWACPEKVIGRDDQGFPVMDFTKAACTFCARCVQACERKAFGPQDAAPWPVKAMVGQGCLSDQGVTCRICGDFCEAGAIRFRPQVGRVARPEVSLDGCTGCGACVAPCPVGAIAMSEPVTAI